MNSKLYIGKRINKDKIGQYNCEYFPDDYDSPCYRLNFEDEGWFEAGRDEGYYCVEIIIDSENRIVSIQRFREIYIANYERNKMDRASEKMAQEILDVVTEDIETGDKNDGCI